MIDKALFRHSNAPTCLKQHIFAKNFLWVGKQHIFAKNFLWVGTKKQRRHAELCKQGRKDVKLVYLTPSLHLFTLHLVSFWFSCQYVLAASVALFAGHYQYSLLTVQAYTELSLSPLTMKVVSIFMLLSIMISCTTQPAKLLFFSKMIGPHA